VPAAPATIEPGRTSALVRRLAIICRMSEAFTGSDSTIAINALLLSGVAGYRRAGIHTYISRIVEHLPVKGPKYRAFVLANAAAELPRHVEPIIVNWPVDNRVLRVAWEQLILPSELRRLKIDLLHSMAFVTPIISSVPAVVTAHDLSFMHYPDHFPRAQRYYLSSQSRRSCRQAVRVTTLSESSKKDINTLFDVPLDKIDVINPGVSPRFMRLGEEPLAAFRRKQQLAERFILHVGSLQPRKNLIALIEALAQLKDKQVELVLVGGHGWMFKEIRERIASLALEGRVRFAGYVSDDELTLWYNAASLLVMPSLYEGFGMPIAQAMACGTPVVASNSSSIPEVAGDAGRLVDPLDSAALANQMAIVLDDDGERNRMARAGLVQASRFTWDQAGLKLAETYRNALAEI